MAGHGGLRRRSATLGVVFAVTIVLLALAGGLAPSLLPGTLVGRDAQSVAAAAIFASSYLALAVGRVPGLAIDRAGVALVGACLMVASGALPLEDAYKAVDLDTLTLLLATMIVVANLHLSGFFMRASGWVMLNPITRTDPRVSGKRKWTSPCTPCARDFSASGSYRLLLALRSACSWCSCISNRPRRRWGARKRWWRAPAT